MNKMKKYKPSELDDYEIDGVDPRDFPDFCDAFLCWAESKDGHELTEEELIYVQETFPGWINDIAFQSLI